jgi:hypothetical protein
MNDARANRVGPWMGIAFVVLFVAGFMVFPTPNDNKDTVKWAQWWTDSGHRAGAIIGAYLMVLGLLAFVWFMWSVNQRLRDRGGMMITFGTLFVALAMVSALVRAAIAGGKQFGDMPVPAGDLSRQFDNIGFGVLLVAGALAAGAFIATASYLARREAILPGWLTMTCYVVAVLQLAGPFFFPFILFPLWMLVASIVLVRHEPRVETPAPVAVSELTTLK